MFTEPARPLGLGRPRKESTRKLAPCQATGIIQAALGWLAGKGWQRPPLGHLPSLGFLLRKQDKNSFSYTCKGVHQAFMPVNCFCAQNSLYLAADREASHSHVPQFLSLAHKERAGCLLAVAPPTRRVWWGAPPAQPQGRLGETFQAA